MTSRSLLRALGMPADMKSGVARLEKSLFELKQDIDAALLAFRAKNAPARGALEELPAPGGEIAVDPRLGTGDPEATPASPEDPRFDASSFDPASTYVCLSPSGGASTVEVTPEFWTTIDSRDDLRDGRLVAVFPCDEDWPQWEMHPHGDEVLVLLSGTLTMVFEQHGKDRHVELRQGRACVVPRGTWHRAIVGVPGRLLSITFGRGTEHRAR